MKSHMRILMMRLNDEIEEQRGSLFLKIGWYEECEQKNDEPCYFKRNPTHWQPLPPEPVKTDKG